MKKNKNNTDKSKFGVFQGSNISNETLAHDPEFIIEEYHDDSLTITEIKESKSKKNNQKNIKPKKKYNSLIYKIPIYFVIILIIIFLIVWAITST